jgi:hypothetical protein
MPGGVGGEGPQGSPLSRSIGFLKLVPFVDPTEAGNQEIRTTAGGSNPAAPSLEYLFDSRTVTYNWPCRIGVSFHCDCGTEAS